MANYIGYFKSLDCIDYAVRIITEPSSSTYKEVILAGEEPVKVTYTDTGKLFDPVRTSTCSVRLLTEDYLLDIYSGEAQGTIILVEDTTNDIVKWCGFLQPNLYSQGYSECLETIELTASDCLNTLQYFDFQREAEDARITDFGTIVEGIMNQCGLIKHYYLTSKSYSDSYQSKVIDFNNFYISEANFYSSEGEPWTMKETLEEICKFFGFTCFQWGDSVYFMDYDRYNASNAMGGIRYSKSDNWSKLSSVVISSGAKEIEADNYRGTGGSMSLDDVFNSIKVNCNYYNIENLLPDLFDDELLTNRITSGDGYIKVARYGGRGNATKVNESYYRIYDHKNIQNLYYTPNTNTTGSRESLSSPSDADKASEKILKNYVGANIIDMIHLPYKEANGSVGDVKNFERYLLISQLNRPWCGAEGTFHWENYNIPVMEFKDLPPIIIEGSEKNPSRGREGAKSYLILNATALFTPFLSEPFINPNDEKGMKLKKNIGCYIYQGLEDVKFDNINTKPALYFYFSLGGKWWNGSGWQTAKTYFEVPLETLNWEDDFWNTEKSIQNNVSTNLFLGTGGYKITLPTGIIATDDMYLAMALPKRTAHLADIEGGDYTGEFGNAYCWVKDISFEIVRKYNALFEDEDTIYENVVNQGSVIDGEEINLKITSDNGKNYSYSTVGTITAENKWSTDIEFYGITMTPLRPEEAIIERYVNQYSTPSIKEEITLDLSYEPTQLITDTWWNKDFVVVGQDIDFQRASQKITLLEKK